MPKIPILLLAAGASSRMGTPKALLKWKGETLIESRIKKLLNTNQPLLVVLGSHSDEIIPIMKQLPCEFVVNIEWKEGMSTSIAYGVQKLMDKETSIEGVIITTIDQPLVDSDHLNGLINTFKEGQHQIIVSESNNGWRGVPALFDAHYLEALSRLKGDTGAKTIVHAHPEKVCAVKGGEKLVDMDTPELYQQLQKATHQ